MSNLFPIQDARYNTLHYRVVKPRSEDEEPNVEYRIYDSDIATINVYCPHCAEHKRSALGRFQLVQSFYTYDTTVSAGEYIYDTWRDKIVNGLPNIMENEDYVHDLIHQMNKSIQRHREEESHDDGSWMNDCDCYVPVPITKAHRAYMGWIHRYVLIDSGDRFDIKDWILGQVVISTSKAHTDVNAEIEQMHTMCNEWTWVREGNIPRGWTLDERDTHYELATKYAIRSYTDNGMSYENAKEKIERGEEE